MKWLSRIAGTKKPPAVAAAEGDNINPDWNQMSLTIVQQDEQGSLFATSEAIAEGAGVEHRAVLQTLSKYAGDFEQFGQVAFEMRAGYNNSQVRIARLNEHQATLLLTYAKNTPQVRSFKTQLVADFYRMAQELQAQPLTEDEIVHQALQITHQKVQALEAERLVLKPKADAWDRLVNSTGTWSVGEAAAALQEHKILNIGRNTLFKYLGEWGYLYREGGAWLAKQQYRTQGLFEHKLRTYRDWETGDEVAASPQVRITGKGLEAVRHKLTSYAATKELMPS